MTASRFLLDAIVAASAVLLLAWLAGLALRRAPAALRHAVWRIAVLAFWLAPAAAIAADALHLQFCPVPARPPPRVQYERHSALSPWQLSDLPAWPGAHRPTHPGPRPEPAAIQPPIRPSPLVLALIAWAAGTALSAACFVWRLRALTRLLRTTSPVPDAALSERVAHWSARVGLRGLPGLARSSALTVPTIAGWRKPLLLLPHGFSAEDPSCDAVLVHELAHIRRADLVAQAAARVTRALWWWHPLAWLAARELHTSAEEACDDWAIVLTQQRRTYADHLVRWAEAARTGGALAYTCGGKTLIGRVRRILAQTRIPQLRSSRRARLVLAFCALAAILGAAILRAQPTPTRRARSSPSTEATMSENTPRIDAELRREADRVWIEGLEKLQWGGGLSGRDVPQNSYLAALTYALQAMGEDVTYDHVMGVSGAAFRVQMGQPNWCPTAPMAPFGFDCVDAAQKGLGISLDDFVAEEPESEAADRAREAASASIDQGKPALFIRFGWEWELVVGHQSGSTDLLLRPYGADEDGYCPMEDKPDGFAVTVIGDERSTPDRREMLLRSLAIAVEMANTAQYTGGPAGAYASGFAAYEYWMAGLLDGAKWDGLDEDALGGPMHANAHCYNSLVDARQQAESYLRSAAREFDGDTAAHLTRAADLYGQVHERLHDGWERVVLPAWQGGTEGWSADMRRAEASTLGEALALERQAIEELRAALASAGKETEAMSYSGSGSANEVLPQHLVELASKKFAESLGDDYIYQAGLPTAYVQALNHAGIAIDFADFAAMSGWAFSFGYKYDDFSTAYLAVRGTPGGDGPYEAFQIAEWLGLGYESARTEEKDELWAFVQRHIDAGTPIISEHYDGGLICGYRESDGKREVWFAVDPPTGKPTWVDINDLHPYEVCVLVKKGDPLPKRELYVKALQRAVKYGIPHDSGGVPQGLAALEAYAADVADPSKDFAKCGEYFCWATFERLMARRCAAVWLERAAEELDQFFGLGAAIARYQHAYELYQEYRKTVGGGDPNSGITREQLRSRQKIAQVVPLLRRALNEERAGLQEISVALADRDTESP